MKNKFVSGVAIVLLLIAIWAMAHLAKRITDMAQDGKQSESGAETVKTSASETSSTSSKNGPSVTSGGSAASPQQLNAEKMLVDVITRMLTPPPTTPEDWHKATISASSSEVNSIRFWTLVNMRPILQAETNATSFMLQASNKRGPAGEIITEVGGNKFANTLQMDWGKNNVFKLINSPTSGSLFRETHVEQDGIITRLLICTRIPPDYTQSGIVMATRKSDFSSDGTPVPFDFTPYNCLASFAPTTYPIAAMPFWAKRTGDTSIILLVDAENNKILDKIPLPGNLTGRPTFVLDKENDVLLSASFDLSWLIAIDLRPYVKSIQGKTPQKPATEKP